MKFRHARLIGALLLLLSLCSRAGTVVTLGSITQINGPADPGLDLVGEMLHAINFSANDGPLVVSGVTFTPDTALAAGVITVGPNQVAPWQTKPDFGIGADNDNLEEVMQDIRWADNNAGQVLSASLPVVSGESYKVQILFYGNHAGDDRRWDIEVEGTLAVDEVSSRGVTTAPFPGGLPAYSGSAAIVYTQTLVAGDSMLNIRMGSLGGANDAGDRNAIWQALTVERLLLVDTDSDGLADEWELAKTQPPNLTDLNGLEAGPGPGANTGDFDGDGSLDINELANNTNPTNKDTDGDGLSDGQEVTGSLHYPKAVIGLNPKFYYRLDETSTSAGVIDAMGSAAPGSYNGDYINGPAMVGGPGPVEAFGGIALPGVGGAANLAHYSNNAGHIVLGPGSNYGANNITVALFLKAGSAQGGDRIFTNNLADNTKSFQIVTANDGLVLAIDPSASGANAERTLFLEDNSGPDRRLIDPNAGWFHVVASTSGATGPERASNFRLWINGIDRTDNLKPNVTGWGINTDFAKIGGRRDNPTDSTTHSGAQDEVSIWLDRVLTETEVQSLWTAARAVTPATDPTKVDTDGDGFSDGIEVNVLKSDPLNPLLPEFSGSLLGHWTFESGSELKDLTGNFPDVILEGDAAIADGALNINGTGTTATGWARSGAGGKSAIGSKTLVSWITLQGLEDVARHGAPMALDSPARDIFDAIVFAERDSNRWMNGSTNFQRTPPGQFDDGAVSVETAPTPAGTKVMLAITYADLGGGQVQITGYRNGVQMGTYSSGFFAQWPAGDQEVLFGPRHTSPGTNGALDALVHEARLYGKAATAAEIMTLFTNGPVGGEPLEFTGIVYNAAAGTADVEWVSKPGKTYRLEWSSDLTTWIETDDSYPTGGAIGNRTTYRFEGIPPNEGKRFFQAIEE